MGTPQSEPLPLGIVPPGWMDDPTTTTSIQLLWESVCICKPRNRILLALRALDFEEQFGNSSTPVQPFPPGCEASRKKHARISGLSTPQGDKDDEGLKSGR